MALVDFRQLTGLYNVHRPDGFFPSVSSRRLAMSRSSPPADEFDSAPSPPSSVQPAPQTPKSHLSAALREPDPTPYSRGTASRTKQDPDPDRNGGYKCDEYDDYVREDLNSRVFVDFGVFIKTVLHAPADWETKWKRVIDAVKEDTGFKKHHSKYRGLCDTYGGQEVKFYEPLVNTIKSILEVAFRPGNLDGSSGTPQHYIVNDPMRLRGGVINNKNLSPDLVALHSVFRGAGVRELHWANALQVLEVKPFDAALCEGQNMPRLMVDSKCATILYRGWS